MDALAKLGEQLPEVAGDIKSNLHAVMTDSSLMEEVRWGVAVASAASCNSPKLLAAVLADASKRAPEGVVADAKGAAVVMGMSNVYFRFRHMVGKGEYGKMPPRLRMNRLGNAASSKVNYELFALAASAIHGCEACVVSHEKGVLAGGMTEENVNDAVRIAAVMHAVAVAMQEGM